MTAKPDVEVVAEAALDPYESAPARQSWAVAFETGRTLLVRVRHAADGAASWHSHGDRDAYAAVLRGRVRVEYGPGDEHVVARAGEFFRVPEGVVHRDVAVDGETVALTAFVGRGDPVVDADRPHELPDRPPVAAGEGDLVETAPLANLTRLTPFPEAPVQQVRGHAAGRIESNWHHHGDNDVFGYVLAGEGYVEWGTGDGERALARAGEFFRVPEGLVHRDVNPNEDEQDYLLWLAGSEPRTVPVDGPTDRRAER